VKRREFLSHGLAAGAGVALGQLPQAWERLTSRTKRLVSAVYADAELPDFSRSFVINTASFNSVRFAIESRTTLVEGPTETVFYQCGAMKAEDTFVDRNLFYPDNYDFMPIFASSGSVLLLRRGPTVQVGDRQIVRNHWGPPRIRVHESPYRELTSWVAMRKATAAAIPLVTRTTIEASDGRHVTIECPTRTMNMSLEAERYQVDVGPVALPDLEHRHEEPLDDLRLAFIAFSGGDRVSIITQEQYAVGAVEVYHYRDPFDLPAVNKVFAAVPLGI